MDIGKSLYDYVSGSIYKKVRISIRQEVRALTRNTMDPPQIYEPVRFSVNNSVWINVNWVWI